MATGVRWQPPRLRGPEDDAEAREATWLELVYDLVFVVAVSELARRLEEAISWHAVATFGLLFVPLWWVWMSSRLYNDRFARDDLGQRLLTFLQLLPVAGLDLTIGQATGARLRGFVLSYLLARAILIALWLRSGRAVPAARPLTTRLAIGSAVGLLPWGLSLVVPAPGRYGLWALGSAVDLLTPLTTFGLQARLPRLDPKRLPERYRVFIVIVLGEAVAGAIRAVAASHRLPLLSGALALAIAFGLGWACFDGPLGRPGRGGWRGTAAGYLLLPLASLITALGAGITDVVTQGGEVPAAAGRWLACGALAVALLALAGLDVALAPPRRCAGGAFQAGAIRVAAAGLALVVGGLGSGVAAAGLVGLLALVVAAQTLLGLGALPLPQFADRPS